MATEQHQVRNERRVCSVLGSPRLPCGRREYSSFEESGRSIRKKGRISSAIERETLPLLDGHRDRHARRLWVSGPSNGRRHFRQKRKNGSKMFQLEKKKDKAAVQSWTWGRELQLKSAWIISVFTSASWHVDRGAVAVFVRQLVIVEGSQ